MELIEAGTKIAGIVTRLVVAMVGPGLDADDLDTLSVAEDLLAKAATDEEKRRARKIVTSVLVQVAVLQNRKQKEALDEALVDIFDVFDLLDKKQENRDRKSEA